jgi:hypothetical protein
MRTVPSMPWGPESAAQPWAKVRLSPASQGAPPPRQAGGSPRFRRSRAIRRSYQQARFTASWNLPPLTRLTIQSWFDVRYRAAAGSYVTRRFPSPRAAVTTGP